MNAINPKDVDEGDEVTIEYTSEASLERTRRTITGDVLEQMGQMVTVDNPFEDDELRLILDPDGDLWAREGTDSSTDGLFGSNAQVVA